MSNGENLNLNGGNSGEEFENPQKLNAEIFQNMTPEEIEEYNKLGEMTPEEYEEYKKALDAEYEETKQKIQESDEKLKGESLEELKRKREDIVNKIAELKAELGVEGNSEPEPEPENVEAANEKLRLIDRFLEKAKNSRAFRVALISIIPLAAILGGVSGYLFSNLNHNSQGQTSITEDGDAAIPETAKTHNVLTGHEVLDTQIDGTYNQDDNLGCYESKGKVDEWSVANPDLILRAIGTDLENATADQRGDAHEFISYSMVYPAAAEARAASRVDGGYFEQTFGGLSQEEAEDLIRNMTPEQKAELQAHQKTDLFDESVSEYGYEYWDEADITNQWVDNETVRHSHENTNHINGKVKILRHSVMFKNGITLHFYEKDDCGNAVDYIDVEFPDGTISTVVIDVGDNHDPGTGSEGTGDENTGSENTGSEITGSEGTGSEDTGSEGTGSEITGSEGTGSEGTGSEGTGSERTGSEGTGSEITDRGKGPDTHAGEDQKPMGPTENDRGDTEREATDDNNASNADPGSEIDNKTIEQEHGLPDDVAPGSEAILDNQGVTTNGEPLIDQTSGEQVVREGEGGEATPQEIAEAEAGTASTYNPTETNADHPEAVEADNANVIEEAPPIDTSEQRGAGENVERSQEDLANIFNNNGQ